MSERKKLGIVGALMMAGGIYWGLDVFVDFALIVSVAHPGTPTKVLTFATFGWALVMIVPAVLALLGACGLYAALAGERVRTSHWWQEENRPEE